MDTDSMPYLSLNKFLRDKFGTKVVKLSIDAGFTCPNRDGRISTGGCIFCSAGGSGDFAGNRSMSVKNQLVEQKKLLNKKWGNAKYIAYFQAFTNTYAPIEILQKKYSEALECEDVVGIAIATRPDCIDEDIISLLKEFSQKTYLWVELGLQTSNEKTALYINRGYKNSVYEKAVKMLKQSKIDVVTHIIFGLPDETQSDMLESVKYSVNCGTDGIKLQLLHVLKNTPLEDIYNKTHFHILEKEEYVDTVCKAVNIIPKNVVIHRLTGDGDKKNIIAPLWSTDKKAVLNAINANLIKKY